MTHLKALLRPSPQRRGRDDEDEDDSPAPARRAPADDEDGAPSSPEDVADERDDAAEDRDDAAEDRDDACSLLSASTLQLPGLSDAADSDAAMTDVESEGGDDEDGIPSPPEMADKAVDKGDEDIFDESQRDSQRPGAWMGSAIALFNRLEKTAKIVVPVDVLYEWLVDGKPAETGEYAGSFYIDDLECLPICFQILLS